jgi:hypothetical protein
LSLDYIWGYERAFKNGIALELLEKNRCYVKMAIIIGIDKKKFKAHLRWLLWFCFLFACGFGVN